MNYLHVSKIICIFAQTKVKQLKTKDYESKECD